MVPDSFVGIWTIEQGNVVRWFGINADIDDRKPVAQKTVRKRAASARDLQNIGEFAKVSIGITVAPWDCMSI
jgi:hypothetical protein